MGTSKCETPPQSPPVAFIPPAFRVKFPSFRVPSDLDRNLVKQQLDTKASHFAVMVSTLNFPFKPLKTHHQRSCCVSEQAPPLARCRSMARCRSTAPCRSTTCRPRVEAPVCHGEIWILSLSANQWETPSHGSRKTGQQRSQLEAYCHSLERRHATYNVNMI